MIVISNTRVVQTSFPFDIHDGVDVVISDDRILDVGKHLASKYPQAKHFDASQMTVIPGMVCSHHHYYSGLSRGMLVKAGPQNDFIQVLKEWWWRLDRALDEEACLYSSLICSIDAIKAGTTCCIDHHASPSFISGSLSTIARGMRQVGIRGMTCYEVTDRNGQSDEIQAGIDENIAFAIEVEAAKKEHEPVLVEAMIGGHAPFTISEAGMGLLADACRKTNRGLHLHVAEDRYDVTWSHHKYAKDIVERLDDYGLLGDKTLLVHGLFLNDKEIEILNERNVYLAHNPRSNMNNHVGYFDALQKVHNLVLGTDGCGGNMFEEVKIAYFKHKDAGLSWWPQDFVSVLSRGNEILSTYFDAPFGRVEPGYKADLTFLKYENPTPLVSENAASHIVWGMSSNCVDSVMVDGNFVMKNREFAFDIQEIYAKASEVAAKVWKKVDSIAP
ncbi:MAG: putative aminohydrolase SsnA [Spirochaetales bacterium]|nr:putative aminohydrolase SsnA [Spirochaetales bacterium]